MLLRSSFSTMCSANSIPRRRAQLLALLAAGGRNQVLVTTTEPFPGVADFDDVLYHTVRAGVVTQDERA